MQADGARRATESRLGLNGESAPVIDHLGSVRIVTQAASPSPLAAGSDPLIAWQSSGIGYLRHRSMACPLETGYQPV
jgi:hypothetical protein